MNALTILRKIALNTGYSGSDISVQSRELATSFLLSCMNAAGKEIASRFEWAALFREYHVEKGKQYSPLPEDFHRLSESGAIYLDKAGFYPVRIAEGAAQWAFLTQRPSVQTYCCLMRGEIHFSPALEECGAKIRYISKYWLPEKDHFSLDEDEPLIPGHLIEKNALWRWRRLKGFAFEDIFSEFEADLQLAIRADSGCIG